MIELVRLGLGWFPLSCLQMRKAGCDCRAFLPSYFYYIEIGKFTCMQAADFSQFFDDQETIHYRGNERIEGMRCSSRPGSRELCCGRLAGLACPVARPCCCLCRPYSVAGRNLRKFAEVCSTRLDRFQSRMCAGRNSTLRWESVREAQTGSFASKETRSTIY